MSSYRASIISKKQTVVKTNKYDICISGCYCFKNKATKKCSVCFENRFDKRGKARRTHKQLEIAPQLASLFKSTSFVDDANQSDGNPISKYFQGTFVQKLIDEVGLFKGKHDLALGLYVDGFRPQEYGKKGLVTVMLQILNLPESERYV